MKLKAAVKYQVYEGRRSIAIFYLVFYLFVGLLALLRRLMAGQDMSSNAMELATLIFMFVGGLNSFKEALQMFIQNGISRRTMLASYAVGVCCIALIMAMVDSLNAALFQRILPGYQSLFEGVYASHDAQASAWRLFFVGLPWRLCAYACVGMLGYWITILYYRMNKLAKVIVSITVPLLLAFILPALDVGLLHGQIGQALLKLLLGLFSTPATGMLTLLAAFVVLGLLCHVTAYRVPLKEG